MHQQRGTLRGWCRGYIRPRQSWHRLACASVVIRGQLTEQILHRVSLGRSEALVRLAEWFVTVRGRIEDVLLDQIIFQRLFVNLAVGRLFGSVIGTATSTAIGLLLLEVGLSLGQRSIPVLL
ncbi:hypothetical protein D3C85_1237610 [compost metagenome]